MEIQWFGTAGFRIKVRETIFLVDPYLSRNPAAMPGQQPLDPRDIKAASHIFISHGHFDHIQDVPLIADHTKARVYCTQAAAHTMEKKGLYPDQMERISTDGWERGFEDFRARAFFSRHVKFDKKLLITTLLKINFKIPRYLPLFREFPCGQVLSWRFYAGDKIIHFFGSAGSSINELKELAGFRDESIDILLVPLQGHSKICGIAAEYVNILQPKMVIPHHQDDFFPPISRQVDIDPFVKQVTRESPGTRVKAMKFNETLVLE
jgi:L-ascorbate metabolism protein UlaG (beta-lactamase superfamily)